MRDVLSEINWQLILMIASISVAVSYLGDRLGKKIGKSRISILGLRPRSTSTLVTIITGLAVAVATLAVASYTSGPVKHAFFGVNYLDSQISQLTVDLRDRQYQLDEMEMEVLSARGERDRLKDEADALRRSLDEMKEGVVVASGGELLAQTVVEGELDASALDAAVARLTAAAEEKLARSEDGTSIDVQRTPVTVSKEESAKVLDGRSGGTDRKLLRLMAPSNIVLGQTVEGILTVSDSKLIYTSGDLLIARSESGALSSDDAVDIVYSLLRQINRRAVRDGVLPDPITGTVGNLDSQEFYEAADKLAEASSDREIAFYAASDIYTEGPVNVRVEISEK